MKVKPTDRQEFDAFDMSSDGFKAAKKYLKQMGIYDEFINTDRDGTGFALVDYANWNFREIEGRKDAK